MALILFKTSRFLEDYREVALRIVAVNPDAANRFCDSVEGACNLISQHPQIGTLARFSRAPKARKWVLPAFPNYIIYYEVKNEGVLLLRLLRGARHAPPLVSGEE